MSSKHYSCSEEETPRKKMRLVRSVHPIIDLTQDDSQDESSAKDHLSTCYDSELFVNPFCVPFSSFDTSATQLLVDGTQEVFDELAKLHYCTKRHPPTEGVSETVQRLRQEVSCLALLWNKVINRAEQRIIELEAMRRQHTS